MSASGDRSPFDVLQLGISFTDTRSLGQLIAGSLAAVVLEITLGIQSIISAFLGGLAGAIGGLIDAAVGLWIAIVGGPIPAIQFSFADLGPRAVEQFGILSPPVVVAIGLFTIYLFTRFLQENETGNLLPGIRDIPFIGRDEESTDDE